MPDDTSQPPAASIQFGVWLVAVAVFFLAFAGGIQRLDISSENDPGPRAFPIALSLVMLFGGIVQISLGVAQRKRSVSAARIDDNISRRGAREALLLGVAILAYYLIVPQAGFYAPSFVFAWLMCWRMGASWWIGGLAAALLLLVIRVLFVGLFRVQLPQGAFGGWF